MNKIKPLFRQIKLLVSVLKVRLFLILGIAVLLGIQPSASIYVNKLLIDNLVSIINQENKLEAVLDFIILLVLFQFVLVTLSQVFTSIQHYLKDIWSKKITLKVTEGLYGKLQRVSYEKFEDPKTLDMFQLALSQLHYTPMQILDNVTNIIQFGIGFAGMSFILISQNPLALIPAVLMSLPLFLFEIHFSKKMFSVEKRQVAFRRKEGYLQHLLFRREHAMELSFFNYREKLTKRMLHLGKLFIRQDIKILRSSVLWRAFIEIFAGLAYWGYYILLIFGVAAKQYTLGDFTLYTGAFQGIQKDIQGILFNINQIYNHALFVSNYYDFLELPEENEAPVVKKEFQNSIEFQNVSFSYPNTEKQVLKNVNITIHKNEKIGLVGENGSGKTTFIKLLLGFYDNYRGNIFIDGRELGEYKKKDLWKLFGVVFQDYQPYYFTAKENIHMASTKEVNINDTREAARQSGVDRFINKLPKKFNTVLGRIFDDGNELSRGQWQKIAISRCFIREAQIFIMDEPAASLDPKSEYEIYRQFHRHAEKKTTILISHRLSNVNRLDRIIVFDDGKIIEEGNHEILMIKNGKYAELFEKQSNGYIKKMAVCQ